ncbi:RNase H domain-containing protein [Trichonephila clavipes]|nr:RNase H domain-containing protein [Trichonephila clavipes]
MVLTSTEIYSRAKELICTTWVVPPVHPCFRIRTLFIYSGSLLRNEVADELAEAATSNPVDPENHMVLTSNEIYSRAKELICTTWVVPPVHPWYFQRHPGSTISFKGSRSYQTAFSRFSTGHLSSRGSRVIKASDRGWPCHEFEPKSTKDPPSTGAMHHKSVESSDVLPLVW